MAEMLPKPMDSLALASSLVLLSLQASGQEAASTAVASAVVAHFRDSLPRGRILVDVERLKGSNELANTIAQANGWQRGKARDHIKCSEPPSRAGCRLDGAVAVIEVGTPQLLGDTTATAEVYWRLQDLPGEVSMRYAKVVLTRSATGTWQVVRILREAGS